MPAHDISAAFRTCFPVLNQLNLNPLQQARNATVSDTTEQSDWGPLQIATPVIVGCVLLLVFGAYIILQRDPLRRRSYDYLRVRSDWVSKIERIFLPRRTRRVHHSSAPFTIDDSMRTASLRLDFRRAPYRSSSSDSQTPLTNCTFGYPPSDIESDSPPPTAKRRPLRWWWLFGSRPREVKPQEPDLQWRVDGPDGSSSGHGNSNHGHEEYQARYAGDLEALREDREEIGDDVIRIGDNFTSVGSTPMTYHFPEQARAVQGMSPVPEFPGSSGARTPVLTAAALQSNPGTPVSA